MVEDNVVEDKVVEDKVVEDKVVEDKVVEDKVVVEKEVEDKDKGKTMMQTMSDTYYDQKHKQKFVMPDRIDLLQL